MTYKSVLTRWLACLFAVLNDSIYGGRVYLASNVLIDAIDLFNIIYIIFLKVQVY